jgi:rod shape-determining protein MreC
MRFIYTKGFGIFFICLVIIAAMVFLQTTGHLGRLRKAFLYAPRPVITIFRNVALPVKNFFITIYQLHEITKENTILHNRIFMLEQDLSQLDQEKRENETLRKELGFVKNTKQKVVTCNVLSPNVFNFTDAITLGCGLDQGINEGQAVVSQGYLIGKIIHSEKGDSTALLITSSKFLTDSKISKTGTLGVVIGSFNSGLYIDQLPPDTIVEQGWLVTTAGINEKIPKNILIGEIGEIVSLPNDLFKKATVISPIDFDNLEFVSVIK